MSATPHGCLEYRDILKWEQLRRGVIHLTGGIYETETTEMMCELAHIRSLGLQEVTLVISSPGGAAYHAFALYDEIMAVRASGVRVTAVVTGYAASAAAMIVLQAADRRVARPNARLLLHEVRRWTCFEERKTSDMKDELEEMKAITDNIVRILAGRTGKTPDQVNALIDRKESWFSAEQARDIGLIDAIE
jgi:ATP-dependent Clp protease protease subunit